MNNDKRIFEKEFSYEELLKINEHASTYELALDKKYFLRHIIPYEQKIILLNSINPYEVLRCLEEIDLKNTNLIINSLSYDEIFRLINLFSKEDKERFYSSFSNLEFVNQFMVYDKNAKDHVQDLTFDRKVELLDSSSKKTAVSTNIVYNSMSDQEKISANKKITSVDGVSTLYEVSDYINSNTHSENDKENNNQSDIKEDNNLQEIQEENDKNITNEKNEIPEYSPYNENFNISNINKLDKDMLVHKPYEQKITVPSVVPVIKTPEEILNEFTKVAKETEKKEFEMIKSKLYKANLINNVPLLNPIGKISVPTINFSDNNVISTSKKIR